MPILDLAIDPIVPADVIFQTSFTLGDHFGSPEQVGYNFPTFSATIWNDTS